jgi:hypothetical protein
VGTTTVAVTVPAVLALPWLTTVVLSEAAAPAFQTLGETEANIAGSLPTMED